MRTELKFFNHFIGFQYLMKIHYFGIRKYRECINFYMQSVFLSNRWIWLQSIVFFPLFSIYNGLKSLFLCIAAPNSWYFCYCIPPLYTHFSILRTEKNTGQKKIVEAKRIAFVWWAYQRSVPTKKGFNWYVNHHFKFIPHAFGILYFLPFSFHRIHIEITH